MEVGIRFFLIDNVELSENLEFYWDYQVRTILNIGRIHNNIFRVG